MHSCIFCSNPCELSASELLVLLCFLFKPFLLTRVCETEDIIPLSFKQILPLSLLVLVDIRCHLSSCLSLSVFFGALLLSFFPVLLVCPLPVFPSQYPSAVGSMHATMLLYLRIYLSQCHSLSFQNE